MESAEEVLPNVKDVQIHTARRDTTLAWAYLTSNEV